MFFRRAFKNGKLRYMFEVAGQTSTSYKRFVVLLFCQSICLDHHNWCTTQLAPLSLFPWSPQETKKILVQSLVLSKLNYLSSADVSPEKDATRTECCSRLCIESLLLRTRCFKTWLATNTRKHKI